MLAHKIKTEEYMIIGFNCIFKATESKARKLESLMGWPLLRYDEIPKNEYELVKPLSL